MSVEHGLHWLHDTAHHCLRWYHWLALVLALVYLANRWVCRVAPVFRRVQEASLQHCRVHARVMVDS